MRALYSAAQAEHELDIKASTVRSWARRELIYSFGLDSSGRPLYDKKDLMRLRSRMRVRVAGKQVQMSDPRPVRLGAVCLACDSTAHLDAPVDLCWDHLMEIRRFLNSVARDPDNWTPGIPKPRPTRNSVVYYIRVGEEIKIGTTAQPLGMRFADLPPQRQLLAVEPGDEILERRRHGQFKAERIAINREWFNPSPRLWKHIESLRDQHGAPDGETHPLAS